LSRLEAHLALALIEALPVREHGAVIAAAARALDHAVHSDLPTWKREQLYALASLPLGIAARGIEDEDRAHPHHDLARLRRLSLEAAGRSTSDYSRHLLEDALQTELIEFRLWARNDLTKVLARDGDLKGAEAQFSLVEKEESSAPAQCVSPFLAFDAWTRTVIIRKDASTDTVRDLLDETDKRAHFRLNKKVIELTRCELNLRSSDHEVALGAHQSLREHHRTVWTLHRKERAQVVAERFGVILTRQTNLAEDF
jgi:hypothetical protein